MRASGNHSFLDLHEKARIAFTDSRIVCIAVKADSPTSAENIAKRRKFGKTKRLAVAALVRLRNYFPEEFWIFEEVLGCVSSLSKLEQKHILAKLPEEIRIALVATRERKKTSGKK